MPVLTIFTATYNRGHLIKRIYDSLMRQSNYDFEWLVIDDGSTDNTELIFKDFLSRTPPFSIKYYKQENRGLIRSLNKGIELASGQFFVKLDSDDYVVDNFIENVISWIDNIKGISDIYAVGGLKVKPDGSPLKGVWPKIPLNGFVDVSDLDRPLYDLDADMTEAWSLDVLRKYPFPVWEDEKFAPEQLVLFDIAMDGYKIRWHSVPLTICEYQEGGLTLGAKKLVAKNPMGYAMMYNQNLLRFKGFKAKCYNAIQMIAFSFYAGHLSYLKQSNAKLVTALVFPIGIIWGIRRCVQFRNL